MTILIRRCRLSASLLTILLAGTAFAQHAAPLPEPLTVDQAVAFALAQNPSVTSAEQNVHIAEAQLRAAQANKLPTLSASVNSTYNPSPASTSIGDITVQLSPEFSSNLGVVLSQPVWPFTRWQAPVASARANVGVNGEALQRTRQQVVFQTQQAFYTMLSAQQLVQVAQDALQASHTQLRLAESTVAAGTAAPLDVYQAQAVLSDAEVNLARAQNTLDLARAALVNQLGLPAETPVQIQAPAHLPTVPSDLDALTETALQQRPEVVQLTYRRQQLQAAFDLIRLQQQPLVNVQGNYNQSLAGESALGASGVTFGAGIGISLYNGGRTKAELEAARTQLAQLDTAAEQLGLGIRLEVRQAYLGLQNAMQQLVSAQAGLAAATEALRIAQIRYESGEGILLEVDQARVRFTQAQTAQAQAQYQAQVSAALLTFALGEPPPAS